MCASLSPCNKTNAILASLLTPLIKSPNRWHAWCFLNNAKMTLQSAFLIAAPACVSPRAGLCLGFLIPSPGSDATAGRDAFGCKPDNPSLIDSTDVHSLDSLTLNESSADSLIPLNWQSWFLYEFEVMKPFWYGFHERVGYHCGQTSAPNINFSPTIPDSNRSAFSVGSSRHRGCLNWAHGRRCAGMISRSGRRRRNLCVRQQRHPSFA